MQEVARVGIRFFARVYHSIHGQACAPPGSHKTARKVSSFDQSGAIDTLNRRQAIHQEASFWMYE